MKRKLRTTRILILDAILIMAFSTLLVVANIMLLEHVNNSLKRIDEGRAVKLEFILRMTQIVRERSMMMLTMYVEDDFWKVDGEFLSFHRIANDFIALREKLTSSGLTSDEEKELNKALDLIRITQPLQDSIVERIHSGNLDGVHADISKKDLPLEIELLNIFESLSERINRNANELRNKANKEYRKLAILSAVVSLLVLSLIFYLMFRALKKIQKIETSLIDQAESLSWEATHDPLTNIYNRRWLEHKLEIHDREDVKGSVHSLVYIDLDDFKSVNDHFGHVAGDQYLQKFCRTVEMEIRQNDVFCRMGGDEFAILLENCDLQASVKIAGDILKRIKKLVVKSESGDLQVGCSIGVCEFELATQSMEKLLERVDMLCYQAKKQGKNCVVSEAVAV